MSAKKLGISPNGCPKCDAWSTEILKEFNDGSQTLHCVYCDHEFRAQKHPGLAPLYKVDKTRYPYHNGSLGKVVNSKEHEQHTAKTMGMVPMEHKYVGKHSRQISTRKRGRSYAVSGK